MKDDNKGTIHEISRNHTNQFSAYFVWVRGSVCLFSFFSELPGLLAETQHFPVELLPKLAELGLMGVIFPEEYGGASGNSAPAIRVKSVSLDQGLTVTP